MDFHLIACYCFAVKALHPDSFIKLSIVLFSKYAPENVFGNGDKPQKTFDGCAKTVTGFSLPALRLPI